MASMSEGKAQERGPSRPSGTSAHPPLSREFIALHKQRRIMDALVELTVERGYEATKISDIVRRAGVARKTLYENFDGKERVFLAAFDATWDELMRRVGASGKGNGDWRDRIKAGLAAFLGYVAEQPVLARLCMIDALSATPVTVERYENALAAFVELIRRSFPAEKRLPDTMAETLVGGVAWILNRQIRSGEAKQAEDLLPQLTEFVIGPHVGAGFTE